MIRRLRRRIAFAVAAAVLAAGLLAVELVGAADPAQTTAAAAAAPTTSSPTTSRPTTSTVAVDAAALTSSVDAIAGAADGTIAVDVLDADGDELFATDATATTYTASLVKLVVVEQLLVDDEAGDVALTDDDLDLMARAIEASADDAMDTLWVRHDGAGLVTAAVARLGLTGTSAPAIAGQWGETTTTAADVATVLATIGDALDADDAATLLGWMRSTTATAADGFDQTYGVLGVDATGTAAKQGWMCCVDSRRQLHSAGVLADGRVVVLLGDFASGTTWSQAQAALDAAAAAVVAGTA
jgi:beta-lactamase class A